MKPEQIVEALEQAASQLAVQVRYETMTGDASGSGGLCKIRGNWCVIMDRKTPPAERAATLIDALTGFDTDSVFLPPRVRETLAARRTERQAPAAATAAVAAETPPAAEAAIAETVIALPAADVEPTI
jgi:hypothetical protein